MIAELIKEGLFWRMAQGEVYVYFEISRNRHQDQQLIENEGSECYEGCFQGGFQQAVSSVRQQRAQGPIQTMLDEEQDDLKNSQIFKMRKQKASKPSNPPSRPQRMKPPYPSTTIILCLQKIQQPSERYMTRVQQKQPSLSNYLKISSIDKAGHSYPKETSLKQIDLYLLYLYSMICQVRVPSFEAVHYDEG